MSVLSEAYIQDCFHSYLRSSLAQAKAERLLDVEVLASAEADLMITGPALCLYFAAIRSTTNPPSVPLPRLDKTQPPAQLSHSNCPPTYAPFLRLWTEAVEPIQSLVPEQQHDLARLICGLPPLLSETPLPNLARLAADLRAVAIEISQRRTFQERYGSDLQAAIDAGANGAPGPSSANADGEGSSSGVRRRVASFRPPPSYDEASSVGAPSEANSRSHSPLPPSPAERHHPVIPPELTSPTQPLHPRPRTPTSPSSPYVFAPDPSGPSFPVPQPAGGGMVGHSGGGVGSPAFPSPSLPPDLPPQSPISNGRHSRNPSVGSPSRIPNGPQSPGLLSPAWGPDKPLPPPPGGSAPGKMHRRTASASSTGSASSPTLLPVDAPAISLIRETLYASLADVLAAHPAIRENAISGDKARAYFGSVALAILSVATTRITPSGGVLGVLGAELTEAACPPPLRPLLRELAALGHAFHVWEEEDSLATVEALSHGREPVAPGAERVRAILEHGAGMVEAADAHPDGRRSPEGRALTLANRINALALRMMNLRPFKERQEEVFKVLVGATD